MWYTNGIFLTTYLCNRLKVHVAFCLREYFQKVLKFTLNLFDEVIRCLSYIPKSFRGKSYKIAIKSTFVRQTPHLDLISLLSLVEQIFEKKTRLLLVLQSTNGRKKNAFILMLNPFCQIHYENCKIGYSSKTAVSARI